MTRKHRKSNLLIVTLLLLVYCLLNAKTISAKTWMPGVAKGDYCYYETYGVYTSSNPNAKIDLPPYEQNNTDWVRVDVTDVSGSVVHQLYTLHFKNGTEEAFERETNVNPDFVDTLSFSQKGIPLCASNLGTGDPFPTVKLTVNDTRIINCLGTERETIHLSWSTPEDRGECYLDRKTGVLVELNRIHKYTNPAKGETVEKADVVKLTRTNLWAAGSSLTTGQILTLVILTVFDVALLIAAIVWNRRKKRAEKRKKECLAKLHENHFGS